ncbi:MAG: hypothetical protein A2583_03310 [Bdellovibrionales bacterium RIFOXYD1_FULL_53_11]|nr:MAG: hypothetical protein A2583_03310 [Bdellovibrionales bacterium RIFOXYD1_FULL_53_11]
MFNLQGGPAILSLADQLSGNGENVESPLDVNPFLEKHCSRFNTGTSCKADTADGVALFEGVQRAINAASKELVLQIEELKIDGIIGPKTADVAYSVLKAVGPEDPNAKVWLEDPRSAAFESMAPLLASQPQFAHDTFSAIAFAAETSKIRDDIEKTSPDTPVSPPPVTVTVPSPPVIPPKVFWTRRKKIIAVVGISAVVVGVVSLLLWRGNQ